MKDDKLYLIHILESLNKIESYIAGLDYVSFMESTIVQDAVLRNLQVLAESTQRLSDSFKASQSDIEWYKIAGLRNILVHDYLGIDLETVWAAVTEKFPELKLVIQAALGDSKLVFEKQSFTENHEPRTKSK